LSKRRLVRRNSGFIAASLVGSVVLGLLSYSFVISVGLPAEERAAPLATIATGIALLAVAGLAYLLQRRSLELQRQTYVALHEPSLGIHYKNPAMYPSVEHATGEDSEVFAEYIMWNAGDVPILIWQPSIVVAQGLGPVDLGKAKTRLERVRGNELIPEQSFPVVLGRGEVCIWRQFTGDTACLRPTFAETHDVDRSKAAEFLRRQEGNRRFLFEVVYFNKPPASLEQGDVRRQYVGFAYQASDSSDTIQAKAERNPRGADV